jgi:hypothetical protein
MLSAAYFILKNHEPFRELGYDYPDRRKEQGQIQFHINKLKKLGITVVA